MSSPRVLRHTPRWLERPAPGFKLFNDQAGNKLINGDTSTTHASGPQRPVAWRGTEVFVAVGNQLRWSDLVLLREQDDSDRTDDVSEFEADEISTTARSQAYKILKVQVHRPIRQLVISPEGYYVAILTSHTVHVAILPHSSQFTLDDDSPLKLKTWQVGPTAHVVEKAAVMTAIWHPKAFHPQAHVHCLVTVTEDAVVRLWELSPDNRWSFDNPSLPLDLRKLANAESIAQDFSPSKYGTSVGFSPDEFDMEAVSASFGGCGSPDEMAWSSLTLWIAMRNGDLYALCPLLPSHWYLTRAQFSELLTSIDCSAYHDEHLDAQSKARATIQKQIWAEELRDQQRQQNAEGVDNGCVYFRYSQQSKIPMLQGPYNVQPAFDQLFDITDVFAIAPGIPHSSEASEEPLGQMDYLGSHPLCSMICLASGDGTLHICLDVGDTQAKWISDTTSIDDESEALHELLLVESVKVCDPASPCWPTFTACQVSRLSLFMSHPQGVSHISSARLWETLTNEIDAEVDTSSDTRLQIIAQGSNVETQPIINFPQASSASEVETTACVHMQDSDVGDFILVVHNGQPSAATLKFSDTDLPGGEIDAYNADRERYLPDFGEDRASFKVPAELFADTTLPMFAEDQKNGQARQLMEKELRLAPATVSLMMEAHRLLGTETGKLRDAVSNLFQRCERMQDELRAQLHRVGEISGKIDTVADDNDAADIPEDGEGVTTFGILKRLDDARSRRKILEQRYEQLHEKVSRLDRRPLNDKERQWIREIGDLEQVAVERAGTQSTDEKPQPRQRYEEVKNTKDDLVRRSKDLEDSTEAQEQETSAGKQRRRTSQVNAMLERETALINATTVKLEQLKMIA